MNLKNSLLNFFIRLSSMFVAKPEPFIKRYCAVDPAIVGGDYGCVVVGEVKDGEIHMLEMSDEQIKEWRELQKNDIESGAARNRKIEVATGDFKQHQENILEMEKTNV
jgi:hypothetical protein